MAKSKKKKDKIFTAIVLDFETGGLDCTKHAITQIGAMAIRLDTFEVLESFKTYITPYPKQDLNQKKKIRKKKDLQEEKEKVEYLEYGWVMMKEKTGITEDMLYGEEAMTLEDAMSAFIAFIQRADLCKVKGTRPIIIGQNASFDISFLEQIFAYVKPEIGLDKLFSGVKGINGFIINQMDSLNLGRMMFSEDKTIDSYSLELLAERLGIDLCDAHDALGDVEATADVIRVLTERMRSGNGTSSQIHKVKTREHFKFK